jgi:hypothetical protein
MDASKPPKAKEASKHFYLDRIDFCSFVLSKVFPDGCQEMFNERDFQGPSRAP